MVAPGLMINLAPGAIVTSPVRVCTPAQVSVPVIVPVVVSFEADTVPAGKANESNMLNKNNPVNENDRNFSSRAIYIGLHLDNLTIGQRSFIDYLRIICFIGLFRIQFLLA